MRSRLLCGILLGATFIAGGGLQAQGPTDQERSTGLLIVAHGADSGWNAKVLESVAAARWDGPRATAFLMGPAAESAGWNRAVADLEEAGARSLVVVPLMVSSHGAHYRQVLHHAGLVDTLPTALGHHASGAVRRPRIPVRVTPAVDGALELGEVMRSRWAALPAADRSGPLLLLAHGPVGDEDAERWVATLSEALDPLVGARDGAPVEIALLRDDAPEQVRADAVAAFRRTISELADSHGDSVLVMTVLVSSGSIDRRRIPEDLAGMPVRYRPTVLAPHAALSDWISRIAREAR